MTARLASQAGWKHGPNDPVVARGSAIAQRIKGTPGITGLSRPRVHIDGAVWHLDVGSSHPGAGENKCLTRHKPSLLKGNFKVINRLKTVKAYPGYSYCDRINLEVNAVGKMISEVDCAYIAGLIDADGAIMALIERHREKKFGFRVRIEVKLTQKDPFILKWINSKSGIGGVRQNRTTFDWLTRDQKEILTFLNSLLPFLKIKKRQAELALRIIMTKVNSKKDLLKVAQLADTLSASNPRSKNRRVNFATKIEEIISPND